MSAARSFIRHCDERPVTTGVTRRRGGHPIRVFVLVGIALSKQSDQGQAVDSQPLLDFESFLTFLLVLVGQAGAAGPPAAGRNVYALLNFPSAGVQVEGGRVRNATLKGARKTPRLRSRRRRSELASRFASARPRRGQRPRTGATTAFMDPLLSARFAFANGGGQADRGHLFPTSRAIGTCASGRKTTAGGTPG